MSEKNVSETNLDEGSVVAFYGCKLASETLEGLYADLVAWFDSLNAHPDRLGVHGAGFSVRGGSFKTNNARLKKCGFSSVTGFDLYHLRTGGDVELWDWLVAANLSSGNSSCVIGVSSSISGLPGESLLAISRKVAGHLRPTYGIGFRRSMRLGPTLYAVGMVMGLQPWGNDRPEGDAIDAWRLVGIKERVYDQGALRDIYPWNFLTASQLDRKVAGVRLEDWIRGGKRRGTLQEFTPGVYLWDVRDDDISSIRATLAESGVIFMVPEPPPEEPKARESPEKSLRSLLGHFGAYDPQQTEVRHGDGTPVPPEEVREVLGE